MGEKIERGERTVIRAECLRETQKIIRDRIVRVLSPLDSGVTNGNLCVKGRFGFDFVQNRPPKRGARPATDEDDRATG